MSNQVLYSTNVYLKLLIQERFYNDIHYVWCSEVFDSNTQPLYSVGSLVPPSASPADIYRRLKQDVKARDRGSTKIAEQKAQFEARAIKGAQDGNITESAKDDIIYMVKHADWHFWRPLLYVIPAAPVAARMQLVPMENRAGFGDEYIIPDLSRPEFDILEI